MLQNHTQYYREAHEKEAFKSSLLTGRAPAHEIYINSGYKYAALQRNFIFAIADTQNETAFQFMACNQLNPFSPLSLPRNIVGYILRLNRSIPYRSIPSISFEEFNEKFADTPYGKAIKIKELEYQKEKILEKSESRRELPTKKKLDQDTSVWRFVAPMIPSFFHENEFHISKVSEALIESLDHMIDETKCGYEKAALSALIEPDQEALSILEIIQVLESWLNPVDSLGWEKDTNRLAFEIMTSKELAKILDLLQAAASSNDRMRALYQWILNRKKVEYPYLISCLSNLVKAVLPFNEEFGNQAARQILETSKRIGRLLQYKCSGKQDLGEVLLRAIAKDLFDDYTVTKDFAKAGFNFNTVKGEKGSTPLGWAASFCKYDLTKLLLDHGADLKTDKVRTAMTLLDKGGAPVGFKVLKLAKVDQNSTFNVFPHDIINVITNIYVKFFEVSDFCRLNWRKQ